MGVFSPVQRVAQKLSNRIQRRLTNQRIRNGVHLVHGPAMTKLAETEVALVLVGRDVAYFLDHHIAHHRKMGVSHIVYIDNGSTDGSIDIARRWPDITIATCDANFKDHEGQIRYLANTLFLDGVWRLIRTSCWTTRIPTTCPCRNWRGAWRRGGTRRWWRRCWTWCSTGL